MSIEKKILTPVVTAISGVLKEKGIATKSFGSTEISMIVKQDSIWFNCLNTFIRINLNSDEEFQANIMFTMLKDLEKLNAISELNLTYSPRLKPGGVCQEYMMIQV